MGIFKIFKRKNTKKIEEPKGDSLPLILKTDNVSKTITEISKQYNISLSSLDFDVLDIQTYLKFGEENDYILADEESLNHFQDKSNIINEEVKIKQSYEIKVRKYDFIDEFELLGKMKVNRDLCGADYYISPSSLLIYSPLLEEYIIEELTKKKLRNSLLVGVFEDSMMQDIEKLVAKIRVLGSIEESERITLCKGLRMVKSIDGAIIEHYKKKLDEYDEFGNKINFKKKGLVYPVEEGDVIIEVIKPKLGINGRNCKGELLVAKVPKEIEIPKYIVQDDIEIKEDETKIEYIVKKNGYLAFAEDKILIKDELEIRQINLRTGSVVGAENSNVKLEITENDALKEAIGDGMKVETTKLHIKGNVGNGARIKAKELIIEGQTHKKSKIASNEADINIHKGYLKANDCTIHRLEGGIVEAKKAHIIQATSGKVKAREIYVDILGSHITLISSHYIEIETIKGSENTLIIKSAEGNQEELIKSMEEKIEEGNILARNLKSHYDKNRAIIMKNKPSISKIKAKLKSDKENGINSNPQLKIKLRKFNELVKKTKEFETKIKHIKEKNMHYKEQIDDMQVGVFGAKIVAKSEWKEYNRMEFKLVEPPMNFVYDTKAHDISGTYMLVEKDELVYKIERV